MFVSPGSRLSRQRDRGGWQRCVTSSPIAINAIDHIINCNIASGSPTCTLPFADARSGLDLIFKDVGAQFGAHPLTISCSGSELIDGSATLVLNVNRQFVKLRPFNDGVNAGWFIEV